MALDDSKVVSDVVDRLKKQGLFDKFRKECMADVDTKVIARKGIVCNLLEYWTCFYA